MCRASRSSGFGSGSATRRRQQAGHRCSGRRKGGMDRSSAAGSPVLAGKTVLQRSSTASPMRCVRSAAQSGALPRQCVRALVLPSRCPQLCLWLQCRCPHLCLHHCLTLPGAAFHTSCLPACLSHTACLCVQEQQDESLEVEATQLVGGLEAADADEVDTVEIMAGAAEGAAPVLDFTLRLGGLYCMLGR